MSEIHPPPNPQAAAKAELQAILYEKKLSITQFALDMDYTYMHAWRLVSGESVISDAVIGRLLRVYGVAVAERVERALSGEPVLEPEGA